MELGFLRMILGSLGSLLRQTLQVQAIVEHLQPKMLTETSGHTIFKQIPVQQFSAAFLQSLSRHVAAAACNPLTRSWDLDSHQMQPGTKSQR